MGSDDQQNRGQIHQFHNASTKPVRLLCICSPAGQEKFFIEVGVPVAMRTTPRRS
jgi:uncharacterized cupin superfamily protein